MKERKKIEFSCSANSTETDKDKNWGQDNKLDISPRAIHQCSAEGKSDITEKINGKYAVSNETL